MGARWTEQIEAAVDSGAAVMLGGAVAYAATRSAAVPTIAASAAVIVFLGAFAILRSVTAREPAFALASFAPVDPEFEDGDELLLTEADRFDPQAAELVLEDILTKLREGARVVRLFDPAAMPGAGEFNARSNRHLNSDLSSTGPPDASEALHAALSELRRSLR